jgi:peroxiredoxin
VVIGIAMEGPNVDKETAHTRVTDFSSNNGMPYVNFIVDPEHQDIKEAYGGIPAVPTTFIIDKNGNIVEKLVGMRDKATFMASINKVLK